MNDPLIEMHIPVDLTKCGSDRENILEKVREVIDEVDSRNRKFYAKVTPDQFRTIDKLIAYPKDAKEALTKQAQLFGYNIVVEN